MDLRTGGGKADLALVASSGATVQGAIAPAFLRLSPELVRKIRVFSHPFPIFRRQLDSLFLIEHCQTPGDPIALAFAFSQYENVVRTCSAGWGGAPLVSCPSDS